MKEEIIQFSELPYYLTVKKIINDDSVKVVIESKIQSFSGNANINFNWFRPRASEDVQK